MRVAAILAFLLCTFVSAHADTSDSAFRIGPWQGEPENSDGLFAFCGMTAIYGQQGAPVMLTVGLDRDLGWMVAVSSDQFKLPFGKIKAGLAFDDERPVDVQGDVKSPVMMSFRFDNTEVLNRHLAAKKLVLIFRDVALPFMLPRFTEAAQALKDCLKANMPVMAATPQTGAAQQIAVATPGDAARQPILAESLGAMAVPDLDGPRSRLFPDLIEPVFVGFTGSVFIVVLAGSLIFGLATIRMRTRYQAQWSREYRATSRPIAPATILRPSRVRAHADASVAA